LFSWTPRKRNSLEIQFQLVNNQLELAVIETADEVMTTSAFAPASEPKLTNPTEF
jgi:hypothetical protein